MHNVGYQAKILIKLALPLLIAQVTQTMMGFIDTIMAGSVSATDMAAVALGSSLWLPALLFVQGLLLAFTPVYAHHFGAKNPLAIRPLASQAFYIAIMSSIGVIALLTFSQFFFSMMDLEPQLFSQSVGYLDGFVWGVPAFILYQVLRGCGESMSYTLPTMVIGFVGLAVNIPANYIFIYGKFGVPAMGGAGCGVATALVFWAMFIAMVIYIKFDPHFKILSLYEKLDKPNWSTIWSMLKHGFPIAMALFFEVSLFAVIALLLAPLGATVVAGHQIALNFSSIVFMFPLSLGIAVSIRVGHYLGKDQANISALVCKVGGAMAFTLACITATITVLFKYEIAQVYNTDPEVVTLAGSLMMLAAIYQLSDSVQVVTSGALRGYKDTASALYITLFSYWFIGVSVGYTLGGTDLIVDAMGAQGYWLGLIAGLTSAAILFTLRLRQIQKRPINKLAFSVSTK